VFPWTDAERLALFRFQNRAGMLAGSTGWGMIPFEINIYRSDGMKETEFTQLLRLSDMELYGLRTL